MEEYKEVFENESRRELEKIDITSLFVDFCQGLRKLWWLILVLTVVFAIRGYFATSTSYVSQYVAEATVSVTSSTGSSAEDMAQIFPYILSSGVLADVVAEDMGLTQIPGTVSAVADEGTNLLTISVTSSDPQVAYNTLQSVLKNYPEVAEFVVGKTKLTVLDETGIPSDTRREEVIRGSYKRGALKGAGFGFAILAFYVLTRRTVKSKKELKNQINLMDCGSIPYIQVKKRKKKTFNNSLCLLNERISQGYVEAIRKLRIKVMKDMEENQFKTLMITSSIPGEGKTTLAVNLAISIANQGKKVVLIDCDMRNPSVAGVLKDQDTHPGLGAVLKKETALNDALTRVETGKGSLEILYGGNNDEKNTKLLGTKRMEALIHTLKKQADLIILDTAPSGILADAAVLARYVDAALYVIRYDHTKMQQIREGIQSLAMSGIHLIGYTFNGDSQSRGRGYGYGYGYGYRRYSGYSRYGMKKESDSYRHYGNAPKGTQDQYGRIIKE